MDSKGIKTTYTLIECIAHYLSIVINWLDPEVAVSFYRKNSIVLQKILSLQSRNYVTHCSFIRFGLRRLLRKLPRMFNQFFKSFIILKYPKNKKFSFLILIKERIPHQLRHDSFALGKTVSSLPFKMSSKLGHDNFFLTMELFNTKKLNITV